MTIYLSPADNVTSNARLRAIKSLYDAVEQLGLSTHLDYLQSRVEDLVSELEDMNLIIDNRAEDDMSTAMPVVL